MLYNLFLFLFFLGFLGEDFGVGVKVEYDVFVDERVFFLDGIMVGDGVIMGSVERVLDFRVVDEMGEVGLGDDVGGEEEVVFESRGFGGGVVDVIKGFESGGGLDDEVVEVIIRGELEEVKGGDGVGFDIGDVVEINDEFFVVDFGVVDD